MFANSAVGLETVTESTVTPSPKLTFVELSHSVASPEISTRTWRPRKPLAGNTPLAEGSVAPHEATRPRRRIGGRVRMRRRNIYEAAPR